MEDDAALSFLASFRGSFRGSSRDDREHPGHRVRLLVLEPGDAVDVHPRDWADVLVVVERGRLHVECDSGAHAVFEPGAVLVLSRLELRRLRSVGTTALVVSAVSRRST